MKALTFVLSLLAALLLAAVLLAGWFGFQGYVLYPLKHARLEAEAADWNAQHWQTGDALTVTVARSTEVAGHTATAQVELRCLHKKGARQGGIKGPPAPKTRIFSLGPDSITVPFGGEAMLETNLRLLCQKVYPEKDSLQVPYVVDSYWVPTGILPTDRRFRCGLAGDSGTTRGRAMPLTVLSIQHTPIRTFLSREAFDTVSSGGNPTGPPLRLWLGKPGAKCWRGQTVECVANALAICGKPLGARQ